MNDTPEIIDLRELLLRKGRTQRQCGVDQCYANQLVAGIRNVGPNALRRIAEAIGASTEDVLAACRESVRRAQAGDLAGVVDGSHASGSTTGGDQ